MFYTQNQSRILCYQLNLTLNNTCNLGQANNFLGKTKGEYASVVDQVPWILGVCGMNTSGGCQESNQASPWDENSWRLGIAGGKWQMLVIFLPVFMAPVGHTGSLDIWSGPIPLFTLFHGTIPIARLRLFIPFQYLLNHFVALPIPFKITFLPLLTTPCPLPLLSLTS